MEKGSSSTAQPVGRQGFPARHSVSGGAGVPPQVFLFQLINVIDVTVYCCGPEGPVERGFWQRVCRTDEPDSLFKLCLRWQLEDCGGVRSILKEKQRLMWLNVPYYRV